MSEENKEQQLSIYQKLAIVQSDLKAPKNQFNSFGKYKYRNLEDIQEGLKPILKEVGAICLLSDLIEQVGERYYVKATARFICTESGTEIKVQALARESLTKKGMDESQITGTASSYARKYALNGLYAIDDTKDADTDQHNQQQQGSSYNQQQKPQASKEVADARKLFTEVKNEGANESQLESLTLLMKANKVKEFTKQAGFMLAELKEK